MNDNQSNTEKEAGKKKHHLKNWIIKHWKALGLAAAVFAVGLLIGLAAMKPAENPHEPVTSRLEFQNLGELTTQEALITLVDVMDYDRKIFGVGIPFTQSKVIYSYDVRIKAGVDFTKITYETETEQTEDGEITVYNVQIPEAEVTDCYVDNKSFETFDERESIFTNITMEMANDHRIELEKKALEKAKADGLLKRADDQAKILIEAFIKQSDPDCKVEFTAVQKK